MISFITGSRAYGTPTETSDIDLVICSDTDTIKKLWELSDDPKKLMFGRLNLVTFNIDVDEEAKRYDKWRETNQHLIAKAPVTREFACGAFSVSGADKGYGKR